MKKFKILFLITIGIILTSCRTYNNRLYPSRRINFTTETGITKKLDFSGAYFFQESSEHFKITTVGFYFDKNKEEWGFTFGFDIKNKNIDLEYVKVDAIIPNQSITLIDDDKSMKQPLNDLGFMEDIEVKYDAKARTVKPKMVMLVDKKKVEVDNAWYAKTNPKKAPSEMVETYGKIKCFYLVKFTIKAKGFEEEVIYQASALPIKLPYAQYEIK